MTSRGVSIGAVGSSLIGDGGTVSGRRRMGGCSSVSRRSWMWMASASSVTTATTEPLLSSKEPVVAQFLNAQRVGPIGMSEEKDADELAAEADIEMPPLPPIPAQISPTNGLPRRGARPAGQWCRENGVTPPPGSFGEAAPMAQEFSQGT